MLRTPVLFIVFNRPKTTKLVFDQIRAVKPPQLFIAADGPRYPLQTEVNLCKEVQDFVIGGIDWPCEVKTLFRSTNQGCGPAVSSAISWFFEHVEAGIILEDDCVPTLSFFYFCQEMLQRHANTPQAMMISGTNYFFQKINHSYNYFFATYYPIWGWATWRHAWQLYDFNLTLWRSSRTQCTTLLQKIFVKSGLVAFWSNYFDAIVEKKVNTWDVQWAFACIMAQGCSITPIKNLVSNIGIIGTHTNGLKSPFNEMPVAEISCSQLISAPGDGLRRELDLLTYKTIGAIQPLSAKIASRTRACARRIYRAFFPLQKI